MLSFLNAIAALLLVASLTFQAQAIRIDDNGDVHFAQRETIGDKYEFQHHLGKTGFPIILASDGLTKVTVKISKHTKYVPSEIEFLEKINKTVTTNTDGKRACIQIIASKQSIIPSPKSAPYSYIVYEQTVMSVHDFVYNKDKIGIVTIDLIRVIARQLLQAVRFIHEDCKDAHTNINLKNLWFVDLRRKVITTKNEVRRNGILSLIGKTKIKEDDCIELLYPNIRLAGFDSYAHSKDGGLVHFIPPEMLLWRYYVNPQQVDLWQIGCVLAELYISRTFDSKYNLLTVNEEDRALFHVSGDKYEEKLAVMMQETLQLATGESVFPVEMQNRKVVKFDASGKPQPSGIRSPGWSFRQLELYIISDADKMDAFNLFDLIRGLLKIKGDERMTPDAALRHEFMKTSDASSTGEKAKL